MMGQGSIGNAWMFLLMHILRSLFMTLYYVILKRSCRWPTQGRGAGKKTVTLDELKHDLGSTPKAVLHTIGTQNKS